MNGFHSSSVLSLLMCWDFRAGKHIERKLIDVSIPGFSEVYFGTPNNFHWSCPNSHPAEWDFPSLPQGPWVPSMARRWLHRFRYSEGLLLHIAATICVAAHASFLSLCFPALRHVAFGFHAAAFCSFCWPTWRVWTTFWSPSELVSSSLISHWSLHHHTQHFPFVLLHSG